MFEVGNTLTLAELISRSQAEKAFATVLIKGGLVTVIYQNRGLETQEYWQAVPETDHLVLKRFLPTSDKKVD